MADRFFEQYQGTLEKGVVALFVEVVFLGVYTVEVRSRGVASFERKGTGRFDLVLQDRYQRVLGASAVVMPAQPARSRVRVNIQGDESASATPTIYLAFRQDGGAQLVDLEQGDRLFLTFHLSNSTAPAWRPQA